MYLSYRLLAFVLTFNLLDTRCLHRSVGSKRQLPTFPTLADHSADDLSSTYYQVIGQNEPDAVHTNHKKNFDPLMIDSDFLLELAQDLEIPEFLLFGKPGLLESLNRDLEILQLLFKSKNKTTKNDRKHLRNRILKAIYGRPELNDNPTEPDIKSDKLKCIGQSLPVKSYYKEIRF